MPQRGGAWNVWLALQGISILGRRKRGPMPSKATMIEALYSFLDSGEMYEWSSQDLFDLITLISKKVKLTDVDVKDEVVAFCKLDGRTAGAELYKYLRTPMLMSEAVEWVEKNVT